MKKYVVLAFLLFGSSVSVAEGPGWTDYSKVVEIVVTVSGGINVKLSPELSGCTSQSGYGVKYASVYIDHPGLKSIHSNLLTAMAASKDVRLWFSDSTCKVGEMRVYSE
jgi:hypothetical protein